MTTRDAGGEPLRNAVVQTWRMATTKHEDRVGTLRLLRQRLMRRRTQEDPTALELASVLAVESHGAADAAGSAENAENAEIEAWVNALEGAQERPPQARFGRGR